MFQILALDFGSVLDVQVPCSPAEAPVRHLRIKNLNIIVASAPTGVKGTKQCSLVRSCDSFGEMILVTKIRLHSVAKDCIITLGKGDNKWSKCR